MSSSRTSTPCEMAYSNAGIVFSGRRARAPRWPSTSTRCAAPREHAASAARIKSRRIELLCGPAAVDEDIRAGDEARVFGTEIGRESANFFHAAPAVDRDVGEELRVELRILHERRVHFRAERPGADAVDRDALIG